MEIANYIILIASLIGAVGVIVAALKRMLNKLFAPIYKQLSKMDVQQCRMFLIGFLCDLENGVAKDEVQYKLAHEVYDRYTNELHQNSYVHDKWDRIMNKKGVNNEHE